MANFSIRGPLQGEIFEFVKNSGFEGNYTTELVRDLTCLLASYREEDVPLFPNVYIVSSRQALASLSPGTQRILVGKLPINSMAEKLLKDCANLAVDGWSIYIAKTGDNQAEYGLFRSLINSYSMSSEEVMLEDEEEFPCILIRNQGHLVVELKNSKKAISTVSFTSAPASESQFNQHVDDFSDAVSSDVQDNDKKIRFRSYLSRLLIDALQHCHGTLLAAHVQPKEDVAPENLNSGVWLNSPINIYEAYWSAVEAKDAQSLATLNSVESLVKGMILCDGVVVFSTNGSILGFRIFLKPTDDEKLKLPEEGGGRRRTYSLMEQRLGNDLKAALFRSQDGQTECKKA